MQVDGRLLSKDELAGIREYVRAEVAGAANEGSAEVCIRIGIGDVKRLFGHIDSQAALLAERPQVAGSAKHERDMLAEAIRDAAVKAGICSPDVPLTGPQLLMLCNDLGSSTASITG